MSKTAYYKSRKESTQQTQKKNLLPAIKGERQLSRKKPHTPQPHNHNPTPQGENQPASPESHKDLKSELLENSQLNGKQKRTLTGCGP